MTTSETFIWPCVQYDDAEEALKFLTEVFGFREGLVVRDPAGGAIVHAELRWPEGGGVMFGQRGCVAHSSVPESSGVQWVYVVTADPDGVYRRVIGAGGRVVVELEDTDYGSRNVGVLDGEGNVWTFGTYAGS